MKRLHFPNTAGIIAGVLILACGAFLGGCAATEGGAERRSLYVDQHPDISDILAEAILNERIMVGMTQEMVEVSWGKPSRVEELREGDYSLLWIYGNYFFGGSVTNLYFDIDKTLVKYEVQDQQTHANTGTGDEKNPSLTRPTSGGDGGLSKGGPPR